MNSKKAAWLSFVEVMKNFLGNQKKQTEDIAGKMFSAFHDLGSKMRFVISHLDNFPENLGGVSDEQGERFHQGFMTTEGWYQG